MPMFEPCHHKAHKGKIYPFGYKPEVKIDYSVLAEEKAESNADFYRWIEEQADIDD